MHFLVTKIDHQLMKAIFFYIFETKDVQNAKKSLSLFGFYLKKVSHFIDEKYKKSKCLLLLLRLFY